VGTLPRLRWTAEVFSRFNENNQREQKGRPQSSQYTLCFHFFNRQLQGSATAAAGAAARPRAPAQAVTRAQQEQRLAVNHRIQDAALQLHEHDTSPETVAAAVRGSGLRQRLPITGECCGGAEAQRCSERTARVAAGHGQHLDRLGMRNDERRKMRRQRAHRACTARLTWCMSNSRPKGALAAVKSRAKSSENCDKWTHRTPRLLRAKHNRDER
jgi:hypothetical protein